MFLLYFLDTYINLVKYLQIVPLDASINWFYLHQDAGKTYLEISNMRSYWKYSKATICGHMKKNIGDNIIGHEEYSGKTTKIVCSTKEKYLTIKQVLARRDGKLFCKKRVMVRADIPPSINKEIVRKVL